MTCIIGFEDKLNNKVFIGADSCSSNLYNYDCVAEPKVFVRDKFIFGYTSTFRFGQLLQYKLDIPFHREDKKKDYEYLVSDFVEAIRLCLKNNGASEINNSVESGGFCLIGYKGKLYKLQADFSLLRNTNGFQSVGCGDISARTAMMVLLDKGFKTPEDLINDSLYFVSQIDSHVKEPFTILSV
jgi:hypothetical protein